jgi:hypothetical protein
MSKQSFFVAGGSNAVLISWVKPTSAMRFGKEVETKMTPVQKIIDNVREN